MSIMAMERHCKACPSLPSSHLPHLFEIPPPQALSARQPLSFSSRSEQFMPDFQNRDTRRPNRPRPMHRRDGAERNGNTIIDRELLAELEREEPLSLAEELDKA